MKKSRLHPLPAMAALIAAVGFSLSAHAGTGTSRTTAPAASRQAAAPAGVPTTAQVAARVQEAIRASGLPADSVGVSIRDVATMALVADARGGTSMVPASNMKVLTTGAALHVLGADWSFRTRLLRDGDRLTVVGDGDPSLGDPALDGGRTTEHLMDAWVAGVRAAGVRRVWELVADDRILDREFTHPSWPADQLNASYCAQVAGLNIHENLLGFVLAASGGKPAVVRTEPASSWVSVETGRATARSGKGTEQTIGIARTEDPWRFSLRGNMKAVPAQPITACVQDPPRYFALYLADRLRAGGIAVDAVRTASASDPAATGADVAPRIERTLTQVIAECNTESHNLYAEALLKRIGAARSGRPGSWASGAQALSAAVDERLGSGTAARALAVSDGSGLSRDNRVAPGLVTAWLASLARDPKLGGPFLASLAIAGRTGTVAKRFPTLDAGAVFVPCKTGYINGVSCLSGCVGRPGAVPRYAFSVMCNDLSKARNDVAKAKDLQERIVMILAGAL
jgi:D-alanyl-D-alanine carboxypeptidase/D-alanyl-D-alanine-endopeptidase (penicillin-binding protein 4)